MAGLKVRKGDTVQVISGKDKGVRQRSSRPSPRQRIIVEGVKPRETITPRLAKPPVAHRSAGSSCKRRQSTCPCVMVVDEMEKPSCRSVARRWIKNRPDGTRTPELMEFGYRCAAVRTSHDNRTRSPGSAAAQTTLQR